MYSHVLCCKYICCFFPDFFFFFFEKRHVLLLVVARATTHSHREIITCDYVNHKQHVTKCICVLQIGIICLVFSMTCASITRHLLRPICNEIQGQKQLCISGDVISSLSFLDHFKSAALEGVLQLNAGVFSEHVINVGRQSPYINENFISLSQRLFNGFLSIVKLILIETKGKFFSKCLHLDELWISHVHLKNYLRRLY